MNDTPALELVTIIVARGTQCLYCQHASEGGERWLVDRNGWLYCGPTCYGRTVEGMASHENDTAPQARQRFVDAFTIGHKVLALAHGIVVGTRGDALLRSLAVAPRSTDIAIARANES